MKIVTIGRDSGNDIVVNDSTASRWHCEIVQDEYGDFVLKDTKSTNGTYVNGMQRRGTIRLNKTDIVRVGNTTLPWQTYFYSDISRNTGFTGTRIGHGGNNHSQNIIKIGRGDDNDINIADSLVSRKHCRIIIEDDGEVTLVDVGSKNGTYVNGSQIHGAIKLSRADVVRIGNTTIPWATYINSPIDNSVGDPDGRLIIDPGPDSSDSTESGLGMVALIFSVLGTILVIYLAIRLLKWGILVWAFKGSTYTYVALGIHIVAYVMASIADAKSHKESDVVSIAKWLSGSCIGIIIGFFIWMKVDPNFWNPFKSIL